MEQIQKKLDELAEIFKAPHALLVKKVENSLQIDASGGSEKSTFLEGTVDVMADEKKIYCQKVIETNAPLIVNDSTSSSEWKGNIDEKKFGLICYLGVPLRGPEGTAVGTVCVLDSKSREFGDQDVKKISELRDEIEKTY